MVPFIRISTHLPTQSGVLKELKIQTTLASGNFTTNIHICVEQGYVEQAVWILLHILPNMKAYFIQSFQCRLSNPIYPQYSFGINVTAGTLNIYIIRMLPKDYESFFFPFESGHFYVI